MVPGVSSAKASSRGLTTVVEREREVDERLLTPALLAAVVLLHNVVDLRDRGGDEQAEDERQNVPVSGPEEDVDRVEDAKEGEAPVDRVNDDLLAAGGDLEDHRAEEKQVDQGPHVERLGVSLDRSQGSSKNTHSMMA